MNKRQTGPINSRQSKGDDDDFNLRETLTRYISHWVLFLICIAVALAGACIYYKFSKPVYEIKATMLMHDNGKDKTADEKSALQELDLVNPPKLVENEIEILKSRSLVKAVVESLQLWASYKFKDGINTIDLYGKSPVKFNLYKEGEQGTDQKIKIKIIDTGYYELITDNNQQKRFSFQQRIVNGIGTWGLTPTSDIKVYIGKTIEISLSDPEATILGYQKAVDVVLKDKLASVIDLTISDQNAKRGEDFLNSLIYYYNESEIAEKNNLTKSTISFIDKRLDSLVGELNNAEGKVEGFRSSKGLTDINAQSQVYLQNVQSNDVKLNDVNIQLNVLNTLENYVNSPAANDRNTPSTIGVSDPVLGGLVQKLSDLQLEKTKLLATLPERNPAFEPINRQIASTKAAIKDNLKTIKSSLLATKQELHSFKSNFQSSISNIPGQERQLVGLKRQQSIKENLYTYLLQKREEVSLSYASSLSNARLVDVAYALPPKASKRLIPFAVAFFLGLIIPAGFIYGKDVAKNTITRRKEIEIATAIPVLAEFSFSRLKSEIVSDMKNNEVNFALIEQFRHLRTQLNIINKSEGGGKITLITSSLTNEGKSFISSNLAVSLSRSGKKTILLEMDIYKPKILKKFGVSSPVGLSEYMKNQVTIDQLILHSDSFPDLSIIGSGKFIDNFSEFLEQPPFRNLLTSLRSQYDHIIIDTPPIHSINDANIIAQYCDTTLFVVRYGHTSKSLLPFIKKLNSDQLLPDMQIVFNGLEGGRDGEGYKYERYYHGAELNS